MELTEIQKLEQEIFQLTVELNELRKNSSTVEVVNYEFQTEFGSTTLLDLFGEHDKLLAIHNMGQACRYCTLWADGFNGFVPHLESAMSLVLLSKDPPELQRTFANSRSWRFKLASHGGGPYMTEQSVMPEHGNMPGAVVYERVGEKILRKNTCIFGEGDIYCSMWNLLGLAGIAATEWTPQYRYWQRPAEMEDGGENLLD
ncbi:MAG: DUF899 family protein [Gammaproteobacteria bacterium]|nr:DUF899 family protein [Gammaproteobacteria bacterium]